MVHKKKNYVLLGYFIIYEAHISPTLNKSSAISWFHLRDFLKICGKIMFATCICVKWAVFITRKATIIAHAHLNGLMVSNLGGTTEDC